MTSRVHLRPVANAITKHERRFRTTEQQHKEEGRQRPKTARQLEANSGPFSGPNSGPRAVSGEPPILGLGVRQTPIQTAPKMGPPKTIPGAIKQPHFRAPTRSTSIGTGTAFHNGFGNLKLRWTCNNPNQCKLAQRTLYLCNNTRPLPGRPRMSGSGKATHSWILKWPRKNDIWHYYEKT